MIHRQRRHILAALSHLTVLTVAFTAFGITLIAQPHRWDNTPAYANLLDIFGQQVWGTIYLVVAGLMVLAALARLRWMLILAHMVAIALVVAWLSAFVIRYLSDSGTTIVNVVSWSTYLYLLIRSVALMDQAVSRERP